MNNGLLFLGALLVAILAALFAVPTFVDWNSYRGVFEEEASKVLGRDVRVSGNVNLKILPVPYVRFEKLRIASITGQTGEPFVRADSFTMWLSVPALLRGVLEASQIELEKPVLSLSVDENGVGNWTKLELKPGDLPFVPRDVALRSVQITDGAVSIYNATSERIGTVDGINGQFSADGLKGPFRYKGDASWGGAGYDVKFATDVPASDGALALKLSARADRSPNLFVLDGRIQNISEKAAFKGRWTGKLQVPGTAIVPVAGGAAPPLLDLKADLTADARGAKFEDLTLTLENVTEPQTISGSANASWSSSPQLDVSLQSKWLDIDALAGAGKGSAGFTKLKMLVVGLMQSVAGDTAASAKINLEQVKIGGENAGGLSVDASRQGNITHLKTFKVSLPGGSRLDLAGDLKSKAGKFAFVGNGFIGGGSFGRFKAWADKSGVPLDINADGPYSAAGKLDIDETHFILTEASGDISGHPLAGEVKIIHGDREHTELTLQAADLDTREVFPKIAAALHTEFRKSLGLVAAADDGIDPKAELPGDVRIRLIAGRLIDGDDSYRDVDVSFAIEGDAVSFPVAKLSTSNGLEIGLEGRIERHATGSTGTVSYDFVGATPDAMRDFLRKTGLADAIGEDRFQGVKDGKIAGLLRLGHRAPKSADLTFDGTLSGARLNGQAEFDGGLESWRSSPSQVQVTVDSSSMAVLLGVLGRDSRDDSQPAAPARLALVSTGTLALDAITDLQVSSADLDLRFGGHLQWPEASDMGLKGTLAIKGGQADQALALVGFALPSGASGTSTNGRLDVSSAKGTWTIAGENFTWGKAHLSGQVTATSNAGATTINGAISTDRIAVPGILASMTKAPSVAAAPTNPNVPGAPASADDHSIWSEGLFDFSVLGNTTASLKVVFKSLEVNGGLATGEGQMNVAITPGKLTFSDIRAAAAGGELTGQASLEKASNGVAFVSDLKLEQAHLATISRNGKGTGTFDLHTEARAQSPAGLVAVMAGSGTAKFAGAGISGPGPTTATAVVDDVLAGKLPSDARALADAFVAAVGNSSIPLDDRDFAIAISDGALKVGGLMFQGPDGTVEGTATADLTTLAMNASFQLTANVQALAGPPTTSSNTRAPAKGPLPPALVLYEGRLDNLAAISATADVASLQRELIVRQMERNVEELEQARRADEERARLERERRKKEAAARAAAQQKAMQQQPQAVAPDAAGTVPPSPNGGNQDDFFGNQPSPQQQPGAQTLDSAAPQPQNTTTPAAGNPNGAQSTSGQPVVVDQATGVGVPKPTPAVRPSVANAPPKPVKRRTSADEMMKSLGGFP
ncbi:AsmA family protein [Hyphomicrobium sp.]|uniref:AsmA family protein n=1 Tax=Hyphomicrobium sp. TaxID=82 RepID=UPI000FA35EB0|nr:AsmA family protein [Hyphomicrobium sp.]RUO98312.1 MAG: AsmA family protein [Hyphomicrobium sp.]